MFIYRYIQMIVESVEKMKFADSKMQESAAGKPQACRIRHQYLSLVEPISL
jgi:hypothetical protein